MYYSTKTHAVVRKLILYLQNALVTFNHLKDKYKSYFDEYKQKEEKVKILKVSDDKKSQMDNTNNNILLANLRNFKCVWG